METSFMGYPFKTMWRGVLTHLAALACLVGGAILEIAGIMNLLIFISFVYTFLMIILLFTSSDGLKPNIPPLISGFFYAVMIVSLVYFGHLWLGGAWLVSGLILGHLTDEYLTKVKELEEKNSKKSSGLKSSGSSNVSSLSTSAKVNESVDITEVEKETP